MHPLQIKSCFFLWCLVLFGTVPLASGLDDLSLLTSAGMSVVMRIKVDPSGDTLSSTAEDAVKAFFVTQTTEACGSSDCQVEAANLGLSVDTEAVADGTGFVFLVHLNIPLPDNARTMVVRQSSGLTRSALDVKIQEANPSTGFAFETYQIDYRMDSARPSICGDSVLYGEESCDDGNTVDGDGCSSVCVLETGFTCYGAWRDPDEPNTNRGKMTAWTMVDGVKTLTILEKLEACLKDDIDEQDMELWNPADWTTAYTGSGIAESSLAPRGYYGKRFCTRTFDAPGLYEFNDSCVPTGIDECSRGISNCDRNAYCSETEDQVGFSCECDEKYFVSSPEGVTCALSGLEVKLLIGGPVGDGGETTYDDQLELIEDARAKLIDTMLIGDIYLKGTLTTKETILEGLLRYPVELVNPLVEEGPLLGRSLWRIVLRAPDIHLNMENMAQAGNIFDSPETWTALFPEVDGTGVLKLMINTVGQCSNDRARSCSAASSTCLAGGTCVEDRPDFSMAKLTGGGSEAPILVGSSGLDVMSVSYDITESAFNIRMRFNNTVSWVIDAVFVSHMGQDQDPLFLPTFNSDEFPCLPLGTGLFQNQRDNSGMWCDVV